MTLFRTYIVVFFLCCITFPVFAQNNGYFFIQVTDPQFGMFEKNEGFARETELYEKAVTEINRLKPAFVVITGDLVNNPADEAQIAEFKRITAKIDSRIPVYYVPGNHDIGQTPTKETIEKFTGNYGYDKFSFKHKGSRFIGINSGIIKAGPEELENEQYEWLKKQLSKSKKMNHTVIFCHYPFFIKAVDEPENYSNIAPDKRSKYLSLFEEAGVDAVFSGHYHNNAIAEYGKIKMITTSAVGKPLGAAPSGLRIVKVNGDRIEHEYYGLDKIPQSVSF